MRSGLSHAPAIKRRGRARRWIVNVTVRILLLIAIALLVGAALNRIALMTDSSWRTVIKRLLVG